MRLLEKIRPLFYESEEFYRNLIAQLKGLRDLHHRPARRHRYLERRALNALGYDRDEFIGHRIKALFTPEFVASGGSSKALQIDSSRPGMRSRAYRLFREGQARMAALDSGLECRDLQRKCKLRGQNDAAREGLIK
jgi:hypothetical protein